jgi:hypothetical protein
MSRALRLMFAGLASITFGACATPYQPWSKWNDGGFTDREVLPGVYLVRFIGNGVSAPERTADLAMLRAAEICLGQGKPFMRAGGLATERVQSGYFDGVTTTSVIPSGDPNVPATVSVNSTSPTPRYSRQSELAVSCAVTPAAGTQDANQVAQSIRARYSLS